MCFCFVCIFLCGELVIQDLLVVSGNQYHRNVQTVEIKDY